MFSYTHHTVICHTYAHKFTGSRAGSAENILVSRYHSIIIFYYRILEFLENVESACNDLHDLLMDQIIQ